MQVAVGSFAPHVAVGDHFERGLVLANRLLAVAERHVPLAADHRFDRALDRAALLVGDMLEGVDAHLSELLAVTLAVPVPVDPETNRLAVPGLMPGWDGVDLASVFADMRKVAAACGAPARAETLIGALRARLDTLSQAVDGAPRPRLAMLEWLSPLMTAGNWGPELAAIAGGTAVLARAGVHSGTITLDALATADPDVIVIAPCSYPIAQTLAELPDLARDPIWQDLRAVRNRSVCVADGSRFFNRPGPRLVDSAEILAEILHPERVDTSRIGRDWIPLP